MKSTLSNLPTYFLSIFKAPCKVIKTIEKMRRDFLWEPGYSKKDHLLKWETVCKLVDMGGLGLGNLAIQNDALLAKWLWRFPKEFESMWHLVISTKYGIHVNGWDAILDGRVCTSCPWRNISKISPKFLANIRYDPGKGNTIKFWEDTWWVMFH